MRSADALQAIVGLALVATTVVSFALLKRDLAALDVRLVKLETRLRDEDEARAWTPEEVASYRKSIAEIEERQKRARDEFVRAVTRCNEIGGLPVQGVPTFVNADMLDYGAVACMRRDDGVLFQLEPAWPHNK